jgi:iron complex transport system substrate-binding protein
MGTLRMVLLMLALAVSAAACTGGTSAGGAGDQSPVSRASFPVTVEGTSGPVTIEARPERIVSLSPTATEVLFAIGAGEQVVAADDRSNFPPEAPSTDLTGLEPNIEAIVAYEPDLVVYATEIGDLGSSLESVGLTALHMDAAISIEDVFTQIEQLGLATGHPDQASTLVDEMRAEIDAIVASARSAEGMTFYYELDDTYYSVTSETFIGQLFAMLGLENIADAAGKRSGGYPQLSAEYIIDADPDLIFLADTKCCGESPATVADRPGWARIAAVQQGNVVPLDDDVASRWGPRVVELLREVAAASTAAADEAA